MYPLYAVLPVLERINQILIFTELGRACHAFTTLWEKKLGLSSNLIRLIEKLVFISSLPEPLMPSKLGAYRANTQSVGNI